MSQFGVTNGPSNTPPQANPEAPAEIKTSSKTSPEAAVASATSTEVNAVLESLKRTIEDTVQISGDRAKALAEKQLERAEQFLAEHAGSPNFFELSKHFAAQSLNDASQLGLSLSQDAQRTLRTIALTMVGALRVFVTAPGV